MGQFYALLAVLLFIVSHSQVKILSHFPVEQVVFIRALGILCLSIPMMMYLKIPLLGVDRKKLFFRGALGTIAIFCYFTTLQNLPLANAVVLAQLAPFFAVFFAGIVLKEKSSFVVYLLFVLALFGVFLIKGPGAVGDSWLYMLGVLGAAFAAFAYNLVRSLKKTDHPLVVLTWFQYVLLPVSFVGLVFDGGVMPTPKDYSPIFLIALFSFLAQVCLTLAYQKAEMSKSSSVNFLSIPLSVVVASVFFGESLSVTQLIGVGVVFSAVTLNTVFRSRIEVFFQSIGQKST
ncbi:MAG: DMT family transporter [Bdellovibrionales bacterium]